MEIMINLDSSNMRKIYAQLFIVFVFNAFGVSSNGFWRFCASSWARIIWADPENFVKGGGGAGS